MQTEFKEKQKFTQWWLWLLLIAIGLFPIYGLYRQLIVGVPFGDKPMSDMGLITFAIFPLVVLFLFLYMRLETEIDQNEIRIKFIPLVKKTFKWEDVKSATVLNYRFVGYGIRLFTSYGTVYNTKGNKGLAIELKNGDKILIGTQKANELTKIIEKYSK
ncbi:hypothetical protein [Flavobacterium sp. 5]|uniref:hypothetical protein n=1 Tax=Flavobacterium sp. 5 TaxID=2035199 RepID=UPI000C2B8578|nr:hypothetical protein [Flavobacterium sp. 5]PKB16547.1 hypothetical protein CLU82_1685 [Flavobacterium sp. 5]